MLQPTGLESTLSAPSTHPTLSVPLSPRYLSPPAGCVPSLLLRLPPALYANPRDLTDPLLDDWTFLESHDASLRHVDWQHIDIERAVGWSDEHAQLRRRLAVGDEPDVYRPAEAAQPVAKRSGDTIRVASVLESGSASPPAAPTSDAELPLAVERRALLLNLKTLDPAGLEDDEEYETQQLDLLLHARYLPPRTSGHADRHLRPWWQVEWARLMRTVTSPQTYGNYLGVQLEEAEQFWSCDRPLEWSDDMESWEQVSGVTLLPSPHGHFAMPDDDALYYRRSPPSRPPKLPASALWRTHRLRLPTGDADLAHFTTAVTAIVTLACALAVVLSVLRTSARVGGLKKTVR
ncbi:hypothetical protein FA09DRAFT_329789 [Tilletiopsis washingtonensis]|uniref:Protein PBN1 n=1 Tax=Tilletiopsis washingtonensis TaxID=58919 RepID=A0A316ZB64_9BASI|nr:hypothetical protein FA09DRAFT_329789 [Tilletiopsis washingtonensis]PWN98162.1 hypothetical protein FA09DRAFT_329789 [Tilletiopsis washingtonensis]